MLAALVRRYGDFDTAEDALQEALLAAARQWPADGVPANPTGWLITVASRRLVDQWRAEQARAERERLVASRTPPGELTAPAADTAGGVAAGGRLGHPAAAVLPPGAAPARAGGSDAAGHRRPEHRADRPRVPGARGHHGAADQPREGTLRQVDARFTSPPAHELPDRVAAVAQVLYLIFTEGHTSTAGAGLIDVSLTDEAIRLTRQLHRQLPGAGEISGLLALMLLTDARRAARIDADGALVPLAEQDRTRWDQARIREGVALLEAALPTGPVGPYQLQAAIAAVHAEAARAEDTDWAQIETLYRMLDDLAPEPDRHPQPCRGPRHGRGPGSRACAMLDPLLADRRLRRQHRLYAVRGPPAGTGRPARRRHMPTTPPPPGWPPASPSSATSTPPRRASPRAR